jgi:predicted TPR repeat methyltransferase
VHGEANCVWSLGNIALERSDQGGACERFEAALLLYQKVGNVHGEANCILRLGDIKENQGEVDAACEHWREALALYAKIPEHDPIGFSHLRLARHAEAPEEASNHREAARKAWKAIGRTDLIEKHLCKGG